MSGWYISHVLVIQAMLINIPLALSFQLALKCGVFSLIGVGFYGVAAYAGAILSLNGQSIFVSTVAPIAACAVLGYALSFLTRRVRGLYLAMSTVAFDLILVVLATNGGSLTGGAQGLYGIPLMTTTVELVIIVVFVILLVSQLERSTLGRSFDAIRTSEDLARSMGVNVRARRQFAFTASAVLGGLSGVLNVLTFSTVTPSTASFHLVVLGLTMAVIGGIKSWWGAALGAVLITWAPTFLMRLGAYQNLFYGLLLVLVVMFAPDGLLGIARRVRARFKRPAKSSSPPEPEAVSAHDPDHTTMEVSRS